MFHQRALANVYVYMYIYRCFALHSRFVVIHVFIVYVEVDYL